MESVTIKKVSIYIYAGISYESFQFVGPVQFGSKFWASPACHICNGRSGDPIQSGATRCGHLIGQVRSSHIRKVR